MTQPSEQDILAILETLVGFPTVSCDSNLALIQWVEEYLTHYHVPFWRIDEKEHKSSLIARVGPHAPGGIVLSGHTDVVPVQGQPWVTDPFTLVVDDEKIYGRGTSDMKAFVALALAHVPYFQAQKLTKPIWFAFSHDEEIGCLGAAAVAESVIAHKVEPSLVVIGEPTMMKLIGAHKGIHSFETIITGHEAHSSMPEQGVNAVMLMGELIATLNNIAADARAVRDEDFAAVTPYASVHVGVVEGGTARNIIPRYCRIAWEVRPLPGTDVDALLAPFYARVAELETEMKARDPQCAIVTNRLTNVRGLKKETDAPHLALACRLANANSADSVAFGTEGGIMQGYGLPVIICGPGSIDQAHQPNEFLSREQLQFGADFMVRIAASCC